MELKEVINTRRSIRHYTDEPITKETLEEILHLAQMAPSWKNSQTTRYYVVCSDAMKAKVKAECLPERNAHNVDNAAALIVMTFKKGIAGFTNNVPDNECGDGWGYYDCGIATQTLLLAAKEYGYGTLVMGLRDGAKTKEVLDIPEDEIVVAIIGLGKAEVESKTPIRKPLEEVAFFK